MGGGRQTGDFSANERAVICERRFGWEKASCALLADVFDTTPQAIAAITQNPQPFISSSPDWAAQTRGGGSEVSASPVFQGSGRDSAIAIPARGGTDKTGLSADGSRSEARSFHALEIARG